MEEAVAVSRDIYKRELRECPLAKILNFSLDEVDVMKIRKRTSLGKLKVISIVDAIAGGGTSITVIVVVVILKGVVDGKLEFMIIT